MAYNFAEHDVFTFSDYALIPEVIQNWITHQPEYPTKGKDGISLGSMKLLDLDTINEIVNARFKDSL